MAALQALRTAFAFLTCVPVAAASGEAAHPARSLAFFPVVGVALGGVLLAAESLLRAHASASLLAVLLVALLAALSGGLHLDGVADVFDALGGGRGDRACMLAIMRDSRIGAHGAAALCLLLLAKVAALAQLIARDAWFPVLVFPAVARWAVLPLIVYFPSARDDGLGASFRAHARTADVAWASVLMIALLSYRGESALAAALLTLACSLLFASMIQVRLGGLTGDVHGAAIELAELTFLVFATR